MARLPEARHGRDALALSDWYAARIQDGHLSHGNGQLTGDMTLVG